jgi:predicted enzyme related to lactoylglutathione lyase
VPENTAVRGVRRIELRTDDPGSAAEHYEELLGWSLLFGLDGSIGGWVGDRMASVLLRPTAEHPAGWNVVFGGREPRSLTGPDGARAGVDIGRPQHGPWAPAPRHGEPCWVELTALAEEHDQYWTEEMCWTVHHQNGQGAERFALFGADPSGEDGHRPVAGRLRREPLVGDVLGAGWMCYFAVADIAAAVKLATELGGTVSFGPAELPTGLVATLSDPTGAEYGLVQDPSGWGGNWSI